ncbi:MAG: cbb3-type cytochrome c oxidase subunit I [Acidobacteria bacterium]|nr:cbb3-type cytochrome c oxidase subunit I [Acidobacteriota bacterium]
MTTLTHEHAAASHGDHGHHEHHGPRGILNWLTSTDHKVIGLSYTITSVIMLVIGGALAEVIRGQLANPNGHLVSFSEYNQLFTMHGSIMIYLFAGPFAFGALANIIVPIQIGAPDMAFPRLNALSYWLYLSGAITMLLGFFTSEGAANFGWVAYPPLSDAIQAPGYGTDLWIGGLILTGFSAIFTGVNICATVFYLRAPGMTLFRMPIFTWNLLVVSILILLAFPVLTAGLVMLYADRHFGTHIYSVAGGGVPVLWQHIFWFWGHPEVYILALPFFGMVTEIIPVFSKKPVFGYKGMVFATITIAALSLGVWAHHMFTTGVVLLPFFSIMSLLIAVPTGIKLFNWIGTMWGGQIWFSTAMLMAIGFVVTFLIGGLTGIYLASPPLDFFTHDTYFVVAHFHSVVMALVLGGMAGLYYWGPKITGYLLNERIGKAQFWLLFLGTQLFTIPQYWLGLDGMPRRMAIYPNNPAWQTANTWSSVGAIMIGISTLLFVVNVVVSWKKHPAGDNPWDGHTLEWFTTSPPPHHNFYRLPQIRSERPTWDHNHPEAKALGHGKDHSA